MRLPNPPIFILESLSFKEFEGNINPNILPKISFLTFGFISFFITFRPQNVKNKVTFPPVAAAPFANTNVAKALSKSSLNRIKVFPLGVLHTDLNVHIFLHILFNYSRESSRCFRLSDKLMPCLLTPRSTVS